jgi:hypothetical protein
MSDPAPERPRAASIVSLRGFLVAGLAFAGSVHLLLAVPRASGWRQEAEAFAATGAVQLAAAVAVLLAARRPQLVAALVAAVAPLAAWAYTRTAGYPLGPFDGRTLEVHGLELLVAVAELGAATLALAGLLTGGRLLGPDGPRLATIGPSLIALSLLPGLVAAEAVDTYVIETTGATHTHTHGTTTTPAAATSTLTLAERSRLGDELGRARTVAMSLPTAADAVAAGLVVASSDAAGVGTERYDQRNAALPEFDVTRPLAWIYANGTDDAPVIGLLYDVVGTSAPQGFTGSDDAWHPHAAECVMQATSGQPFTIPQDDATTGASCEAVGGAVGVGEHWMLRVWVVPGWENPWGTFAHGHPAGGMG